MPATPIPKAPNNRDPNPSIGVIAPTAPRPVAVTAAIPAPMIAFGSTPTQLLAQHAERVTPFKFIKQRFSLKALPSYGLKRKQLSQLYHGHLLN